MFDSVDANGRPGRSLERRQAGVEQRTIRLLTFTTLFPHAGRPTHGIFVENRLKHLLATGQARSTVIAPVPWFPSRSSRFGDWGRHGRADSVEERGSISVHHPRYAMIPRFGMSVAPASLAASAAILLRRLIATGLRFDVIDAHYLYPDGVAAILLGKVFHIPVVITARGSDVTQLPDYRLPRSMIRWAMDNAAALIAVSNGLKNAMVSLGASPEAVCTLRNGVDLDAFRPSAPTSVQVSTKGGGPVLLSVGHLIERKRHNLAIQALLELPGWTLNIVGEGPELAALTRLAQQLGVGDRVTFCGAFPHETLPAIYSSADVLILASSREGWANVLLEAMACGTPVVASNIPGNPEVVTSPIAGEVVEQNTPQCFARAIKRVYERRSSRQDVRAYASNFSWDATSQGQLRLFRQVIEGRADQTCSSI